MDVVLLLAIASLSNIACFFIGAKVGQTTSKGEPVETPYGNGYIIEDCVDVSKVRVQFSYGEGIVNKQRVTK